MAGFFLLLFLQFFVNLEFYQNEKFLKKKNYIYIPDLFFELLHTHTCPNASGPQPPWQVRTGTCPGEHITLKSPAQKAMPTASVS